jgi:hypothetical protein
MRACLSDMGTPFELPQMSDYSRIRGFESRIVQPHSSLRHEGKQRPTEGGGSAPGRMTDRGRPERALRQPADGDDAAAVGELVEERLRRGHLFPGRTAIRIRPSRQVRVRRDDVPAERLFLETELGDHAPHDRRRRLGRSGAGQLPFRGEGDAGDARSPIAGSFAHQEERSLGSRLEVGPKPLAAGRGTGALPVEVEGRPDAGTREPLDELLHPDPNSD